MAGNIRQLAATRTRRDWSLADQVYERILNRIVDGDFPLKSRLPSETVLSDEMGVSRPVLRSALKKLREDGIVFSRQGSGSYVQRQPDKAVLQFAPVGAIADIQRNFEFRVILESEVAALAAQRWTEEELAEIEAAYDELEGCIGDGRLGGEEDALLHLAICDAADNNYFYDTLNSMNSQVLTAMTLARSLSLTNARDAPACCAGRASRLDRRHQAPRARQGPVGGAGPYQQRVASRLRRGLAPKMN